MRFIRTTICAATLLTASAAMTAEVSGNVALGTDYFFRGVDQSGGAALSGGFDVAFDSGLYIGTWASSLDFSDGPELDYYIGYGGDLTESVAFDVGYLMYGYPGYTDYDFNEMYGSLSFGNATVGMAYSDDYFDSSGETTYFYVDYGFDLSEDFSLSFHYGTIATESALTVDTDEDGIMDTSAYNSVFGDDIDDYSITLSTEAAGLGIDFSLVDSNGSGSLDADTEFTMTISKSL